MSESPNADAEKKVFQITPLRSRIESKIQTFYSLATGAPAITPLRAFLANPAWELIIPGINKRLKNPSDRIHRSKIPLSITGNELPLKLDISTTTWKEEKPPLAFSLSLPSLAISLRPAREGIGHVNHPAEMSVRLRGSIQDPSKPKEKSRLECHLRLTKDQETISIHRHQGGKENKEILNYERHRPATPADLKQFLDLLGQSTPFPRQTHSNT